MQTGSPSSWLDPVLLTGRISIYVKFVLPRWLVKDPGHSDKKCTWHVTPKRKYTPSTQLSQSGLTMLSRHSVGTYQGKEPTRNSSRNTRPQLSGLILTFKKKVELVCASWSSLKKKKKRRHGMNRRFSPRVLSSEEKRLHHHHHYHQIQLLIHWISLTGKLKQPQEQCHSPCPCLRYFSV